MNYTYRKLSEREIERAGERERKREYKEINDYFHKRKSGPIKWKDTEESLVNRYGKRLGKTVWKSEQVRRKGFGKYIQKQKKTKYQRIKRLLDKQKKTKLEEWEVEYEDRKGVISKWKEFRKKYYKLVWNKNARELQWEETYYERKVSKTAWREI